LDDGGTANHPRGADAAKRSGRRVRGTGGFRACGETGRRRIGRGRSRRPGARSSGASAGGDFVVCGSMVPGSAAAEFTDGRRTVPGREDAAQRNEAGGAGTLWEMFGAAEENGARTRDPVLRMLAAGRVRG